MMREKNPVYVCDIVTKKTGGPRCNNSKPRTPLYAWLIEWALATCTNYTIGSVKACNASITITLQEVGAVKVEHNPMTEFLFSKPPLN